MSADRNPGISNLNPEISDLKSPIYPSSSTNRRRRGMSIVEVLISLAISATLLTAAAAAFSASASAVEANDRFFRATQAARISVNLIMAEVRRCQSAVIDKPMLELHTASGERRIYSFNDQTGKLTMVVDGAVPTTYTMASNVQSVEFDTDGDTDGFTITMTVVIKVGNERITLNGSAMPRRVVTYQ